MHNNLITITNSYPTNRSAVLIISVFLKQKVTVQLYIHEFVNIYDLLLGKWT